MADPTIERNVVIAEVPPPARDDFPKWVLIPVAALGIVLLFILFFWMSRNDDTANVNINVSARRPSNSARDTSVRSDVPNQVTVPSGDTSTDPSSVQTVPGESVASNKGAVVVNAKVSTRTGGVQPVKNEKFYLLDKDLDEILEDAGIEDETGQGLRNTFGLSVLYPERYGTIRQKALSAIARHTKHSSLTDAAGKALMNGVDPGSYYLFGITKTRNGFAIWSSSVTITTGENLLNLSPVSITEAQ